jgi:DNA modification methylase
VHRVDARELREDPRFGLVLCSPPYPGVYDYLPLQTLRMAWLGLTGDESAEIGSRRDFRRDPSDALRRWRADTGRWVRAAHRAMRPGGRMAVVIGDGFGGGQVIDSLAPLTHAAEQLGLRRVARATTERWDAGVEHVRPEHAVLFERPT